MSDSHSPKEDHPRSHPGASQGSEEIQQKAREARETAQDTVAQTHTILSRTRQLLKQTEEIGQHRQARREYEAEHATSHAMPAPRVGIDILRTPPTLPSSAMCSMSVPCPVGSRS